MAKLWKKSNYAEPVNLADLIQQKLDENFEIRPFPAAVTKLLAAIREDNATSAKLAEIIECDAALAMRLLRMANSPLYGIATEVRSVAHATSVLGLRSLRTLAMSAAGAAMFSQGTAAAKARQQLWQSSLASAAIARELAASDPTVTSEDAFLACIFHDVGKLFFFDIVPDEYESMNRVHFGASLIEQEKSTFGATHEEIGLKSAHSWNLAENLKVAVGYHHRLEEAPAHSELTLIVHLADELTRAWGIGCEEQGKDNLSDFARKRLESDGELLAEVRERSEVAFAETKERLCV